MSQEQKDRWNATRREKRAKKREESDPKVQELRAQLRTLELSRDVEVHRMEIEDVHSIWERTLSREVGVPIHGSNAADGTVLML